MKFYTLSAGLVGFAAARSASPAQCHANPLSDRVFQTMADANLDSCWTYPYHNLVTSEMKRFVSNFGDAIVTDVDGNQVTFESVALAFLDRQFSKIVERLNDPEIIRALQAATEFGGNMFNLFGSIAIDGANVILSNPNVDFNDNNVTEVQFAEGAYSSLLALINSLNADYIQNNAVNYLKAFEPALQYAKYALTHTEQIIASVNNIQTETKFESGKIYEFAQANQHLGPKANESIIDFFSEYMQVFDFSKNVKASDLTQEIPQMLATIRTFFEATELASNMLDTTFEPEEPSDSVMQGLEVQAMALTGTPEFQDMITSWEELMDQLDEDVDYSDYNSRVRRNVPSLLSGYELERMATNIMEDAEGLAFVANNLESWGNKLVAFVASQPVHDLISKGLKELVPLFQTDRAEFLYTEPFVGEMVEESYEWYGETYTYETFKITSSPIGTSDYRAQWIGKQVNSASSRNPNWATDYTHAIRDVAQNIDMFNGCEAFCEARFA